MSKKLKILYAEDEFLLREVTTELLSGEGFDCCSVQNGVEAMEKLKEKEFDLLITDFKMPLMDGAQLLMWMRKSAIHIPVIFVSGNLERAQIEEKALGDCCSSLLIKPVSIETLVEAIDATQKRKHEFDCKGEMIMTESENAFYGQHILPK